MNFIVADIGNTFIKICTVDEKTLKIKRTNLIRSDKKINFLKINKIFKKKIRKEVLFASVVPQKFFLFLYWRGSRRCHQSATPSYRGCAKQSVGYRLYRKFIVCNIGPSLMKFSYSNGSKKLLKINFR